MIGYICVVKFFRFPDPTTQFFPTFFALKIRRNSCQNGSTFLAPDRRVPGQPVELGVHLRESAELILVQIAENLNPYLLRQHVCNVDQLIGTTRH